MQSSVTQIEPGQKPAHGFGGRNLHHMLRVRQERAVHGESHRHSYTLVFGDAIADQHMFERFLRSRHPTEQPPHVAHGHRVVMLNSKRAGVIERPVADQEQHGQTIRGCDDQRFEAIAPAGTAAAGKCAGVHGTGMFDNFELRMFAVGDDIFRVQFPIRDDFGQGVHHFGVRTNWIRGNDVDVGQTHRLGDGLASRQ